jgi:hypothetical protein
LIKPSVNLMKDGMLCNEKPPRKKIYRSSRTSNSDEDEEGEYEVEKVFIYRKVGQQREFFIKWKGYKEFSWVSSNNCNFKELVDDFFSSKALHRLH